MKRTTQQGFIIPLAIIIIAALAIGGGVYAQKKAKQRAQMKAEVSMQASSTISTNGTASTTATGSEKVKGSIRSLLALGTNSVCTISGTNEMGTVNGTVYISGQMMRGDFTMTQSGKAMESHMIRNGNTVYAWTGTQGAKMTMDMANENATSSAGENRNANANVALDQKVDYSCSPWTKDDTKFAVPTTVNFVDVSAMMKGAADLKAKINGAIKVNR